LDLSWCPPPPGKLKINIDASFPTITDGAAVSCLCRDSSGKLIDGSAHRTLSVSPLQAETQALISALRFLITTSRNQQSLLLESDSLTVVAAILDQDRTPWEFGALFAEARALLRLFPTLTIQYCRRETNAAADWAAKAQAQNLLPANWVTSPPPALFDLLCTDTLNYCNFSIS